MTSARPSCSDGGPRALAGVWLACLTAANVGCGAEAPVTEGIWQRGLGLEVATWTRVQLPRAATARAFHGAVYDHSQQSVVIFGGRTPSHPGLSLSTTGLLSGSSWTPLPSGYARRGYVRGAFDGARARVVSYGGFDPSGPSTASYFAETWELSGSTWRMENGGFNPGRRSGYGIAYDSRRQVTVLFGGFDGAWLGDLYEWDGATWSPRCATAPCASAPRPAARSGPVLAYDEARGVTVLFGGRDRTLSYEDTWSWDGEGWTQHQPPLSPDARASAASTYDPVTRRVLLFGGTTREDRELNDFWAWDGAHWSAIAQASAPFARQGSALVWDAKGQRGLLLGGSSAGLETDAWTFTLSGSPCSTGAECHSGACLLGACVHPPEGSAGQGGNGAPDGQDGNAGGLEGRGGGTGQDGPVSPGDNLEPGGLEPAAPRAGRSFYSCAMRSEGLGSAPLTLLSLLPLLTARRRARAAARA
jgi:hypothetical protein